MMSSPTTNLRFHNHLNTAWSPDFFNDTTLSTLSWDLTEFNFQSPCELKAESSVMTPWGITYSEEHNNGMLNEEIEHQTPSTEVLSIDLPLDTQYNNTGIYSQNPPELLCK